MLAFSRFDLPTRLPVVFFLFPAFALNAKGLVVPFFRCNAILLVFVACYVGVQICFIVLIERVGGISKQVDKLTG